MNQKDLYRRAEDAVRPLVELQRHTWTFWLHESGIMKQGPEGPYHELCAIRKLALVNRARQELKLEPLTELKEPARNWRTQITNQ
jgi:hypothetical protein